MVPVSNISVLDARFSEDSLPKIYSALKVSVERTVMGETRDETLWCEVAQHLGGGRVKRLFQGFRDAAVSEQIARMVAMKAATDAAEKMIKRLTRQYNRARQTQITMELLDIVGGASALA